MKKLIYLLLISTLQPLYSATGYTPSTMNQQLNFNNLVLLLLELSNIQNPSVQVREILTQAKKNNLLDEILLYKSMKQNTLLHIFLRKKQIESALVFIQFSKKKHIQIPDGEGRTAAHYSALLNNPDLMTKLQKKDPDVFNVQDSKENTPLHLAVKEECIDIIPLLIEYAPDTISIRNKEGNIPAHFCSSKTIIFFQPYQYLFTIKNQEDRTVHDILVESFAKQKEEPTEPCIIL